MNGGSDTPSDGGGNNGSRQANRAGAGVNGGSDTPMSDGGVGGGTMVADKHT